MYSKDRYCLSGVWSVAAVSIYIRHACLIDGAGDKREESNGGITALVLTPLVSER